MAKLVWDEVGVRTYETGVDHGVLYIPDPTITTGTLKMKGIPWNGLVSVSESPSGAEANPIYADNIKYLNLISAEEFAATIEAYTYPDEFAICDGSATIDAAGAGGGIYIGQQRHTTFGLSYRTKLGNDIDGDDYAYKLHIIYGCTAAPSEKAYQTINDSPEPITFSWELSTVPVNVDVPGQNYKPTSIVTMRSDKLDPAILSAIEDALYGTATANAYLPTPSEILTIATPVAP